MANRKIILLVVALVALLALCRITDAQGAALELGGAQRALLRRGRGADDGANHDANDDKGGNGGRHLLGRALLRRGRGADDGVNHDANDDKGGNGGRHLLGRCTTDAQCGYPKKKCVNGRCEDNIDDNSGH